MASISKIQKPSSSASNWKYTVFLSFRGEDTRNNFVGHLYKALDRCGIYTYKDDITLERGKTISPELLKAIEESRFSIVVVSQNYAFSTWCLDELVKIIECVETKGQIVVPIFYNVDPSQVRNQGGIFAKAFVGHVENLKEEMERVQRWREALTKLGSVSGWDSRKRDESILIEQIVKDISKKLSSTSPSDSNDLVGMDKHVEQMDALLRIWSNDVHMVGIWGMGGIGKTTLANVIYNRLYSEFEGSCFLANVKEKFRKSGPMAIQEELLSKIFLGSNPSSYAFHGGFRVIKDRLCHKKVLMVLDDVDTLEQLEFLARNCDWFGLGSRIIITTRDKHLLITHGVHDIYEVKNLENDEALQLFKQHAFKQNPLPEEYLNLSNHAVYYARGLPLAIKVLGSFLYGRSKQEWESALKKLEKTPNTEIQDVLRISFDGLDDGQKDIFLDIACFFKGENKDHTKAILDGCGFYTDIDLTVLVDKSLLIISFDRIEMHDLLQQMGWEIIRQESIKEIGKRSRLWIPDDIYRVLTTNTGSEKVEGILLDLSKSRVMHLGSTAFKAMYNVRLLKFYKPAVSEDFVDTCKVHLPQGLESLSNELRCLHWHRYPLTSFPSNFSPENLVELNLPHSNIEQLWEGDQHLVNLKQINLSHCTKLIRKIDLTGASNLERIILDGCTSLHEAPSSISHLQKLTFLSLRNCERLAYLPSTSNLEFLKNLHLSGCSSLTAFPEIPQSVEYLDLSQTAIEELPSSIECLNRLHDLKLIKCTKLESLPSSISKLNSLSFLDLSGCSNLCTFPEIMEPMQGLWSLNLDETGIKELPPSIEHLTRLKLLYLRRCKNLLSLPSTIWSLKSIEELWISGCSKLHNLPGLPCLTYFTSSVSNNCNGVGIPLELMHLFSIRHLELRGNNFEHMPASIKELSMLYTLDLSGCKKLRSLPELPLSLSKLIAHDCTSLETVSISWRFFVENKCMSEADYYYTNCFKLTKNACSNILANFLWRTQQVGSFYDDYMGHSYRYKQGFFSRPRVHAYIPGSEIPAFFSYQSAGSSLTVQLPQNWYNRKFVGFAMCAVVAFKRYEKEDDISDCDQVNSNDGSRHLTNNFLIHCELEFNCYNTEEFPRSDHIVLAYDANLARGIGGDDWPSNKVSFKFNIIGGFDKFFPPHEVEKYGICLLYVKECGVSLIYAQDKNGYDACLPYFNHDHGAEPSRKKRRRK